MVPPPPNRRNTRSHGDLSRQTVTVGGAPYSGPVDVDALVADLDASQRAAVTAESQLVAVIAGAGSGKTRVLTRRIAYRIATGSADARHTLALTFTREAAGEMRRRLLRLGLRERVEAGTFHSVMLAVLKQRWADTDRRPLTIVADRRRLVSDAIGTEHRQQLAPLLAEIDWASARGIGPSEYASIARRTGRRPGPGVDRSAEVYDAFDTLKRRRGVIDFDDVLAHVLRESRRDSDFADSLRWRFRHLLVDEAQDLNPLQHALVDLLRAGRDDVFLVGDPAQAIYGFNGADPSLLVDVEVRFPGVEVIRLPVNHRSTPQIVDTGRHVLAAGGQPFDLRAARGDGDAVLEVVTDDEAAEVQAVTDAIRHADPNLVRTGEIAVLTRTNAQLGPFADALRRQGVSVRRSATATGSPLQTAVRSAAALGSASRLRAWAHDVLDGIGEPPTAVGDDTNPPDQPDPERRVAASILEFLREQPLGDGAAFRAWVATTNPFDDASTDGVDLLTFHAAKGREWHTVFVAGVESSLVPHKSAHTNAERAEEARLLYVACTRATDHLELTRALRRGGYARSVSPFLAGLDAATPPPIAPPPRRSRTPRDPLLESLRSWRDEAARRANILPTQVCTDRDLRAIAEVRPHSADELAAATSFGPMTAERLAPEIVEIVQSARSTITGA